MTALPKGRHLRIYGSFIYIRHVVGDRDIERLSALTTQEITVVEKGVEEMFPLARSRQQA